jgi:hypothetical protein
MAWVLIFAGLLTWAGATFIIDAVLETRRHPDLGERLAVARDRWRTMADEAQDWLGRQ